LIENYVPEPTSHRLSIVYASGSRGPNLLRKCIELLRKRAPELEFDLYIYTHPEFNYMFDGLRYKFCGRVPSDKFRSELAGKSILLYMPETFAETFCITAVEAQLMNLLCIHNGVGALKEVVKHGCLVDDEDGAVDVILDYVDDRGKYDGIISGNRQNCIESYSMDKSIDMYESL
jgi:glycosyltransferase involved in cell wall biosynthesis